MKLKPIKRTNTNTFIKKIEPEPKMRYFISLVKQNMNRNRKNDISTQWKNKKVNRNKSNFSHFNLPHFIGILYRIPIFDKKLGI